MNSSSNRLRLPAALAAWSWLVACGDPAPSPGRQPATLAVDSPGMAIEAPGEALGAAVWLHPSDPARNLLLGAAGAGGLVLRGVADGVAHAGVPEPFADFVAVTYGFEGGLAGGTLVVAHDRAAAGLWLFTIDPEQPALLPLHAAALPVDTEVTGLCLYRSPASGRYYAFVSGGDGMLQQWEISTTKGRAVGRQVRSIALGAGIGACAVDDTDGAVYVADESVGIWRVAAEPESDPGDRHLVDRTGEGGSAGEEVKGLAVHNSALLALLDEGEALNVYALPGAVLAGTLTPAATASGDALGEIEAVWAGHAGSGEVLILSDGEGPAGPRWRIIPWAHVAAPLKLPAARSADPRSPVAPTAKIVQPSLETRPVDNHGDAADDIAIWVHPRDPARSLIIGAQKKRGLEVYDLAGRRVQLLADGRMNNVDLRQGVDLGDGRLDIVAASNRTHQSLSLYAMDAATGRLRDVAAGRIPTGMRDPYGLCMYVSARDGAAYVFVNNSDRGEFGQWKLESRGGRVGARLVREFVVGSQAEGCVADDQTGALYIAEEDVGLWRYSAEPDGGDARRQIDSTGAGGRLRADAEGLALFQADGGTGYLVLSNQGADNYALYRREGENAFAGFFSIGANEELGIDGASETDGLEVTSRPLGPAFPHGLLVVQDGRNITPAERQNFKLVPWERVAGAVQLQ
jgi:3-phytase